MSTKLKKKVVEIDWHTSSKNMDGHKNVPPESYPGG
jgi:hypothetical protein